LQRRFPIDDVLLRSGDIRDQISGPNFINLGSPSTKWQSLVTIGQATLEVRRQKRRKLKEEDLNDSSKT